MNKKNTMKSYFPVKKTFFNTSDIVRSQTVLSIQPLNFPILFLSFLISFFPYIHTTSSSETNLLDQLWYTSSSPLPLPFISSSQADSPLCQTNQGLRAPNAKGTQI